MCGLVEGGLEVGVRGRGSSTGGGVGGSSHKGLVSPVAGVIGAKRKAVGASLRGRGGGGGARAKRARRGRAGKKEGGGGEGEGGKGGGGGGGGGGSDRRGIGVSEYFIEIDLKMESDGDVDATLTQHCNTHCNARDGAALYVEEGKGQGGGGGKTAGGGGGRPAQKHNKTQTPMGGTHNKPPTLCWAPPALWGGEKGRGGGGVHTLSVCG